MIWILAKTLVMAKSRSFYRDSASQQNLIRMINIIVLFYYKNCLFTTVTIAVLTCGTSTAPTNTSGGLVSTIVAPPVDYKGE